MFDSLNVGSIELLIPYFGQAGLEYEIVVLIDIVRWVDDYDFTARDFCEVIQVRQIRQKKASDEKVIMSQTEADYVNIVRECKCKFWLVPKQRVGADIKRLAVARKYEIWVNFA